MKILLLNQFFWPDSAATSQLLTDLARGLRERGHEVHVVCAGSGYSIQDKSNDPGVQVHRVKAIPFVRGKMGRLFSYLSFLVASGLHGVLTPKTDLVITLTTPPLLSLIGTLIKFLRGTKHFIWEMDVYPDVAVDLNYIASGGLVDRVTGALADLSRRRADGILALGNCMRDRLAARGISPESIHVAHNWADGDSIRRLPRQSELESLTLLYSGNLGLAHDADTIFESIRSLAVDARFRFIFAGGGPLRKSLENRCRQAGASTVEFRPYSSREQLGDGLGNCDIGLITQRETCAGSVVPSKVYGLLAAGRPILFVGPAESTVAEIIRTFGCGWHIENGDHAALTQLLLFLVKEQRLMESAGRRAREVFEKNYDLPLGVGRICAIVGAEKVPARNPEPVRKEEMPAR